MNVVHIQLVSVDPDVVVPPGMPGQWAPPKPRINADIFSRVVVPAGLPEYLQGVASSSIKVRYEPPPTKLVAEDMRQRQEDEELRPSPAYRAVLQVTKPIPMLARAQDSTPWHGSRFLTEKPVARRPGFVAPASNNPRPPLTRDILRGRRRGTSTAVRKALGVVILLTTLLCLFVLWLMMIDNGWIDVWKRDFNGLISEFSSALKN